MSLTRAFERAIQHCLPARWRTRLKQASPHNRAIVRGMFWVAIFVLAAKLIAAGKEIAVAWRYGTSATLDGYLLVFNLVSWPVSLAFSVMSFVLVPWLVRQQSEDGATSKWRQRQVTGWVWLLAIGLTVIFAFGLTPLIASGLMGLSAEGSKAALAIMPYMAAMVGLGVVAGWHACQLMSVQRHWNSFLEAMPALGILIAVLLARSPGADPLLWGTLAGCVAQVLLLAWVARGAGMPITPVWPPGHPFGRALTENAGWLLAAQLLMSAANMVDQIVLAHLQAGSLATYSYANRVMALVLTLGATVVGRAFLPVLSGLADPRQSYRIARRWIFLALCGGAVIAVLLVTISPFVVGLLFERGAFVEKDTIAAAQLLSFMALQLPFYLVLIIWWNWFLAWPGHGKILWKVAVFGTLVKLVVLAVAVGPLQFGVSAVVMAEVMRIMVLWAILQWLVVRLLRLANWV